jgi:hypothetical protein
MPDPDRLLRTIYRAVEAIRNTQGRKGRFVQLAAAEDIVVAGDLHGHLGNFQIIHQKANLAANPRRHLILQEVVHGQFRYPKGGDKSHQILDLFCAMKCQFPQQVHLLLGNHEMAQWNGRPVMKGQDNYNRLFREGVAEAYGEKSDEIYNAYLRLFGALPIAVRTPNRIFLSHSLPVAAMIPKFEQQLLETDVIAEEDFGAKGAVFSLLWGRDPRLSTVEDFLRKVNSDWLITGHLHPEAGFAVNGDRHIIVDSSTSPGSFSMLSASHPLTVPEFHGSIHIV